MKLYTSDCCAYDGMDQDTVTNLRTDLGHETHYITEEAYLALLQQIQARP